MFGKVFDNRERGFTLIELLIVCVILGVLAAAIIPNLAKFISTSKVGAANTELATVKNGITGYIVDHSGNLPCTVQPTIGDPQPLVDGSIQQYLSNGPLLGGYLVNVDGSVVGDPVHPYPGLTWDVARGIWTKQ